MGCGASGLEIRVEELVIGYGRERISGPLSFSLKGPALVQVLGPNGAGKTTLLRTILGLIPPLKGHVYINGVDVTGNPSRAGKLAGYVPQLAWSGTNFPLTAWEAVEMVYLLHSRKWPRLFPGSGVKRVVENVLGKVGLPPAKWFKDIRFLSGGEKQRVMIARALVADQPVLLMDEPFSAVDPAGRASLAKLVAGLAEEKLVVVTSHDPMLLLEWTDKIILINRSFFAIGAPEEVLTLENTRRVYGEAAIPVTHHIHISDQHVPG